MAKTLLNLAVQVMGVLGVVNGGTGQSNLGSGTVLLGNGTGLVNTIAPGTPGNIIVDNGTTFVSSAPTSGAGEDFAFFMG